MRTIFLTLGVFLVLVGPLLTLAQALTDDEVREILIEQSIDGYSGNCPCPYNTMRNGRRCGGNSAWSRAGGAAPLCFPDDVPAADVAAYRAEHNEGGIQEVRGRRRSSGGGARSSTRRGPTYDASPPELDDTEDASELPPTRSLEMSEPRAEPEAPAPTRSPETTYQTNPAPQKQASTRRRTAEPEEQRLPDCPPGTSLARWNNRDICVGTPETLSNVPVPDGTGDRESSEPMSFADVLSRLQASSAASGRAVAVPPGDAARSHSSVPATGLLNCRGGTRPTHIDGRIECR